MYDPMAESSMGLTSLTDSLSVTETVNGTHNFELKGYSLTKGMGIGKFIASETFTVGGHQWTIYFYPDGKIPSDNGVYVSIFVALVSEGVDVRALFELKLHDQSGKGNHLVYSHFGRSLENGPYTIKTRGCIWGYKRFFKRKDLEASTFIKDDCLKISCTVGVLVMSCSDSSMLNAIHVPESDIGEDLGMMLDYEELCDVTFSVGGERFRAHKLILGTRSTVFQTWFSNGLGKDDMVIVLNDMESKVFKALLHFIYKDTLMEDEELILWQSCSYSSISESFPAKLLAAAEKFDLPRLKLMCESIFCSDISIYSVPYILVLAYRYRATELKSICQKFCTENYDAVKKFGGLEYLRKNCPLVRAELLSIAVGLDKFTVADDKKSPTLEKGKSSKIHISDA
ncbi:BTB/POZ and MATH domain-containing protein 4-like [Phaseolus vulgaris]|uniref:BTB/POZ and MATH domain-containing protein 4-like n=1 Tax=Phaseolus vulgaris TaxID=3885 RepID=UPI0035CB0739